MCSSAQDERGFVPHIDYGREPGHHESFWGRPGSSTITQPPMYGHAVAALRRRGHRCRRRARRASARRHHSSSFVSAAIHPGSSASTHPWETGCDDSPRFDHWGAGEPKRWYDVKGALVAALPDNGFDCAPVSLSRIGRVERTGARTRHGRPRRRARRSVGRRTMHVGRRRRGRQRRPAGSERSKRCCRCSSSTDLRRSRRSPTRTRSAGRSVLPACTAPSPRSIVAATGAGPVWPQLAYLLWLAGAPVAETTVRGAETSGLSEFWDPDDGTGLGASPQSWTCLAVLMSYTPPARDPLPAVDFDVVRRGPSSGHGDPENARRGGAGGARGGRSRRWSRRR